MRKLFEFFCNDCNGWILINLNEGLRGNFLVECPECGRKHPRTLTDSGKVVVTTTEYKVNGKTQVKITRENYNNSGEVIVPMKSAYSKKPRLDEVESKFTSELWNNGAFGDQLSFEVIR